MTRRVLRVLVEVEGSAFDPDDANPYADSQAELEAVLTSNLQTITSMDAGDVVTLRDTNGNRCGKVEMEDFPGGSPMLPYWSKLSDLALDVEEEFPVSAFIEAVTPKQAVAQAPSKSPQRKPAWQEPVDEVAARAFDQGEVADYPDTPSSHEHVAAAPERSSSPKPRKGGGANVPPPPGDPGMS